MDLTDHSQALTRLIQDGILVCDASGSILECNAVAARLLEISPDISAELTLPDLIGEDAWGKLAGHDFADAVDTVLETQWVITGPGDTETTIKAWITVEFAQEREVSRYVCLLRDITNQRAAEAELSKHRAWDNSANPDRLTDLTELLHRYRNLFESMGEGIVGVEVRDVPRFVLANPAAERLFGVGPGRLVGRKLTDFCVPEDYATLKEQQAQRQAGEISTYEMTLTRPDGERRTIQVTGSPLMSSEGKYLGSFSLLLDITDQRRHETDLEQSRNLLSHAHRLVKMGTWEWDIATS